MHRAALPTQSDPHDTPSIATADTADAATDVADLAGKKAPKGTGKKARPTAPTSFVGDGGLVTAEQLKQWLADAEDPDVVRRLNNEERSWVARRYRELFAALGLSPANIDAATQLLASKRLAGMDVAVASLQQGRDPAQNLEGFRQQVIAEHEKIEVELRALLGDAGYAEYQTYDQNTRATLMMSNLEATLSTTSEPLSPAQSARLKELLVEKNARRVTDAVLTEAGAFLSPGQMRALRDLQAVQLANQQKRLQSTAQGGQALPTTPSAPTDRK